jgi:prevent-host-death family protein
MGHAKTVTISYAKAKLDTLLLEVERTGEPVTITYNGRPVAALTPVHKHARRFGQLPALAVPHSFDDPLPDAESAGWDGSSPAKKWVEMYCGAMVVTVSDRMDGIVGLRRSIPSR